MKETPRVDWARRLLEDQLARVGELRNASPRDAGFKLWRQTTLTVIQRIWPGDLARSERFRRIPFSTMTPKATRAQAKEHYERGCAEAAAYLKGLVGELAIHGIAPPDPNAAPLKPAALPPEMAGGPPPPPPEASKLGAAKRTFDPREMLEPSPLEEFRPPMDPSSFPGPPSGELEQPAEPAELPADPIEPAVPPERPAARTASPPPAATTPPPGGLSRPPRGRALPTPAPPPSAPPARSASPGPPARPGAPPPRPRAEGPPARVPRRPDRRALKEMLGFLDESSMTAPLPANPEPMTPPSRGGRPDDESLAPPPPPPAFASQGDHQAEAAGPDFEPFPAEDFGGDFAEELEEIADDEVASGDLDQDLGTDEIGDPSDEDYDEFPRAATERPDVDDLLPDFLSRTPTPAAAPRRQEPAPAPRPLEPAAVTPRPLEPTAVTPRPLEPAAVTPRPLEPAAVTPRPLDSPPATTGLPRTPAATAFTALAADVERLGVPEGQRAAARAALLDLARQLDDESATWDTVREFLWMVADYPLLAQRAIPLLVPFLDVV